MSVCGRDTEWEGRGLSNIHLSLLCLFLFISSHHLSFPLPPPSPLPPAPSPSIPSQQQVATLSNQVKELVESNRAKDIALKATDPSLAGKVAEKDSLLEHKNREIDQLNVRHSAL